MIEWHASKASSETTVFSPIFISLSTFLFCFGNSTRVREPKQGISFISSFIALSTFPVYLALSTAVSPTQSSSSIIPFSAYMGSPSHPATDVSRVHSAFTSPAHLPSHRHRQHETQTTLWICSWSTHTSLAILTVNPLNRAWFSEILLHMRVSRAAVNAERQ